MVTAADGAPSYYTLENNTTRTEGIDAAIEQDNKTLNAWMHHSSFVKIDNPEVKDGMNHFEEKLQNTVDAVCAAIEKDA